MLHYLHNLWFKLILCCIFCIHVAHSRLLNDTGITTCSTYDNNGLPCPVANFPNQDAEHGMKKFYFTKINAEGHDLPSSATSHSCVRDNVTNLMWEVKTDDEGLHDQDWTYTWYNSTSPGGNPGTHSGGYCFTDGRCDTEKFIQDVNHIKLCGFDDWRLPTEKELVGIVDYSVSYHDAVVYADYFPYTLNTWFWTESKYGTITNSAWIVNFYTGIVDKDFRNGKHAVRLVRGHVEPNSFTVDTVNNTLVKDDKTGLLWKRQEETARSQGCTVGMTWRDALRAADAANAAELGGGLGGNNDWRLPNVKELQSIVDYEKTHYSTYSNYFDFYTAYFGGSTTDWFWSSSPHAYGPNYAWGVRFNYGFISHHSRYDCLRVRLVSGKQPFLGNTGRVFLESPLPDSYESGIGLIRGWACEDSTIQIQIDDGPRYRAAYGTPRSDTQAVCNDTNNGFGLVYNWNEVGDGPHLLRAFADNVEFAAVNFTVTTLDLGLDLPSEQLTFPRGLIGEYVLQDFPRHGRNVTIRWAEPHQNFRIIDNIIPFNSWLAPLIKNVLPDHEFTLDVVAKSNGMLIQYYDFTITFDPTKLELKYDQCDNGICPGLNALITNSVFLLDNATVRITGSGGTTGPGNALQLLKINFKSKFTLGRTAVTLTTTALENTSGANIGAGTRGATVNITSQVTVTPATAALESPQQESFESGVGLIRGWICNANTIEIQIDDSPKLKVGYGMLRDDTKTVCNDDGNNGFGLTYNWGNLSAGHHKLTAYADNERFAEVDFSITNLGTPFLRDIRGEYLLPDFPHTGKSTKIRWSEPHQNFVIIPNEL